MERFSTKNTPIEGVQEVQRTRLEDGRGFFERVFCSEEIGRIGWKRPIAQINSSFSSKKGTIRGMHYQKPPYAEMKLVSCLKGAAWDVVVDLRKNSVTFLQWHAIEISEENCIAVLIPEGCAHGFQSLLDDTELLYCHSQLYHHNFEQGLSPTDPSLAIAWPLMISEISSRDRHRRFIDQTFEGLVL